MKASRATSIITGALALGLAAVAFVQRLLPDRAPGLREPTPATSALPHADSLRAIPAPPVDERLDAAASDSLPGRPPGPRPTRGRVVDAVTEVGIADALVVFPTGAASDRSTVSTAADGSFVGPSPAAGSSQALLAVKDGYVPKEVSGDSLADVEIRLERGVVVAGQVLSKAERQPIPGAWVELRGWCERRGDLDSEFDIPRRHDLRPGDYLNAGIAHTDADGRFQIGGVAGPWFSIRVRADGWRTDDMAHAREAPGFVHIDENPVEILMTRFHVAAWRAIDADTGARVIDSGWSISDWRVSHPIAPPHGWPRDATYVAFETGHSLREDRPVDAPMEISLTAIGYEPTAATLVPTPWCPGTPPAVTSVEMWRRSGALGSLRIAAPDGPRIPAPIVVMVTERGGATPGPAASTGGTLDQAPLDFSLPVGRYRVRAWSTADQARPSEQEVDVVEGTAANVAIPFDGGTLELRVLNERGQPVDGASLLRLSDLADGLAVRIARSRISAPTAGTLSLHLSAGPHRLGVDKPGFAAETVDVEIGRHAVVARTIVLQRATR